VRFRQPDNRIRFDAAIIDLPIVMANRTALRLAQRECERELDELGFDSKLATRVRRLIGSAEDGFRTLEQVAPHVGLSPRTLRRRLAAKGSPFSAMVDDERRDRALRLLRTSDLSIGDVAGRLEYTSASSFVRAFRRWTGKTPSMYRRDVSRSRSDASD
jgi:AraC-like DNA-binding protein